MTAQLGRTRPPWRTAVRVLVTAGVLAVAACGGGGTSPPFSIGDARLDAADAGRPADGADASGGLPDSVPGTCRYEGRTYRVGDEWPAGDGCNTCFCERPAVWACTLLPCPDVTDAVDAADGGAPDGSAPDAAPPLGDPEWRLVPASALNAEGVAWRAVHGVALGPQAWLVAAVGTNGTVALYDSRDDAWSQRNLGEVRAVTAVWIESAAEVLVACEGGALRRWDPTVGERGGWLSETAVGVPETVDYLDAWGDRQDGQWVVGDRGVVVKWDDDGGRWDAQLLPNNGLTGGTRLEAVWGASPADVYAVGNRLILHWNGVEWSKTDSEHRLHGVWGLRDGPFYAAGEAGVVLTLDPATREWTEVQPGLPIAFWSVFGTGGEHVVVGGVNSFVARLGAAGWQTEIVEARVGTPPGEQIPPNLRFVGVWGLGPDNLYLVSDGPLIVRRGRFARTD